MDERGWQLLAPSAVPFDVGHPVPRTMSLDEMDQVENQFRAATRRALVAGFQVVELHMAHGYLLHESLSSLVNKREDIARPSRVIQRSLRCPLEISDFDKEGDS